MSAAQPIRYANTLRADEAERLLRIWGLIRMNELEAEVGYPGTSAGLAGAGKLEWDDQIQAVSPEDIARTLKAMHALAKRHSRLYREMLDHWRDNRPIGWERKVACRQTFCEFWSRCA